MLETNYDAQVRACDFYARTYVLRTDSNSHNCAARTDYNKYVTSSE